MIGLKNSPGVTLLETVVVVAIALPILTILMGTFSSISKTQARSTELENVQQATLQVIHDLSQEIHAADKATIAPGSRYSQLDLQRFNLESESTSYVVSQGRLLKNGVYLTSKDVSVQLFQIENLASEGSVGLLDFTITIASKREPQVQITQQISISLRDTRKESDQKKLLDKLIF